ncbi:MAG: ABC transporter ATP-binding protein [Proteobacteria bacterium]|nr:ABC transporter ATP-binding protein [Pseudomonadota bacterium]
MAAGILSTAASTVLLLLVTFSITMLQGPIRPVSWSELVGEHASRWISPIVRATAYENGLSVDLQKLLIVPALIAFALLGNGLKMLHEYKIENLGETVSRELRQKISYAFLNGEYTESKNVSAALLGNFLGEDSREIRQCFTRLCGSIPIESFAALVYLSLLVFLDTQLFVLFFAIFLPAGIVIRGTGKYLRRLAKQGIHVQTELTQSYLEKIRGWQTIQSFAAQETELSRFEQKNTDIFNIWRRSARAKSLSSPTIEWLGITAGACVLILALRRVSEGALAGSILTAFLITVAQLSNSFQTVVSQLNTTKRGSAALKRINDFLQQRHDGQTESAEEPAAATISAPEYAEVRHIELTTASLKLINPVKDDQIFFENISIELSHGDTLAITGPSGAGKSTLIECLSGLRKTDSGEITLTLNNDKKITFPRLAEHLRVTFLSQEPFIFDSSILENILYPMKQDSPSSGQMTQARECLRHACLEHKLFDEQALSLSGGEKQRLAFARGFMNNPHIWIIDEGTSALDVETEAILMRNLMNFSPASVKIFIAHKASLLKFANKRISLTR